jgi:integrase
MAGPPNGPLHPMARITEAFFRNPTKIGEYTDDLTPNLILVVRKSKTGRKRKSWLVRVVVDGKRPKVGFTCGLAEARRRAPELRQALLEGKDLSKGAKARQRASLAIRCMTFGEAVAQWLPRAPKLRHPVSVAIRGRALAVHLAPIRDRPLTAITPAHIVEILHPLRPETAMRVYTVAKAVFRFGAARLEPEGVDLRLPTDLAKLRALGWSPRSPRSHKPMPALLWTRAPELVAELERRPEPISRLMMFILATASRCKPARLAKRRNIDLKAKTWTIPVDDLKDSEHRTEPLVVPLNSVALAVIPPGDGEYLFTDLSGRLFTPQSIGNFTITLRRFHPDWIDKATGRGFTVHGFRSMFRSWGAATRQDRELVELAMGHTIYGAVERAYQRDPLDELRAELMQRWGRHCRPETAVVVPLRA